MASKADDWQEQYLKMALLWVDKPSFVRAFINPDFKAVSQAPNLVQAVLFNVVYAFVYVAYGATFIATYPTTGRQEKPWHTFSFIGPNVTFVIIVISTAITAFRFKLWQPPMTIKARIACIPPPNRDQGDSHAMTYFKSSAWMGGSLFCCAFGIYAMVGTANSRNPVPVGDVLASLFMRDLVITAVEQFCQNKCCNAQAEAIILGIFGTKIQFADNASGDLVLSPATFKALKWKNEAIRAEVLHATGTVDVTLKVFDLDACQSAVVRKSGYEVVQTSQMDEAMDSMAILKQSLQDAYDNIKEHAGEAYST